ncbi:hypothetical protein Purlil1_2362 [Purpureocillium lilacinum]|uniref:CFEM domain-containing protein n=1 Tax=Purpureocillium lilacinum TaxID=33203 RepID=A0ABR0CAE7_PURLI|nr:hypothetical protein Purlil1_2362 [Purpureocillium lilacinum]
MKFALALALALNALCSVATADISPGRGTFWPSLSTAFSRLQSIDRCARHCFADSFKKNGCESADEKTMIICGCPKIDQVKSDATRCALAGCGLPKFMSNVMPQIEKICRHYANKDA